MTTKANKELDRQKLYNDTQRVSIGTRLATNSTYPGKTIPNSTARSGPAEIKLTLQDLIDKGEELLSEHN